MLITQEKVVNSLINKNLDWKCGEITQTGMNTYYFKAEDNLVTSYLHEPRPDFWGRQITFINGRLTIKQGKTMFDENIREDIAKPLYDHIVEKVKQHQDLDEKRFMEWLG